MTGPQRVVPSVRECAWGQQQIGLMFSLLLALAWAPFCLLQSAICNLQW